MKLTIEQKQILTVLFESDFYEYDSNELSNIIVWWLYQIDQLESDLQKQLDYETERRKAAEEVIKKAAHMTYSYPEYIEWQKIASKHDEIYKTK